MGFILEVTTCATNQYEHLEKLSQALVISIIWWHNDGDNEPVKEIRNESL